jgi:hypothetical protein
LMDPWDIAKALLDLGFAFARGKLTPEALVTELRTVIDRVVDAIEKEKLG